MTEWLWGLLKLQPNNTNTTTTTTTNNNNNNDDNGGGGGGGDDDDDDETIILVYENIRNTQNSITSKFIMSEEKECPDFIRRKMITWMSDYDK